jgi:hypothetical protein
MLKQAAEVFGHAHWCEPELQFPQAPPPALPQGPQALPQQNHDISPKAGEPLLEQPITASVRWISRWQACPGAPDGEEGNFRRQYGDKNKVSTNGATIP